MKRSIILSITLLLLVAMSCRKDNRDIVIKGVIEKQGITTYQYGTHVIMSEESYYALRSSTMDLDAFVSKEVTLTGEIISGYPVDGGPEYIEVKDIR